MIDLPTTALRRLTDECTVKILPRRVTGGSGFFIAPGLVLTCAHVVDKGDGSAASTVTVEFRGTPYSASVRAEPKSHGSAGLWAYPDLCVLRIEAPPSHKSVVLGGFPATIGSDVYLGGYSTVYDTKSTQFQGKSGRIGGPASLAGGQVWELTDCEMAPGMSGGPILDLKSGAVCAVVKTSRRPGTDMGGLAIPVTAVKDAFPDVWREIGAAADFSTEWAAQRSAVRQMVDRLGMLTPDERQSLEDAAQALGLHQAGFNALWYEIAGDLAPVPRRSFRSITDLAEELSDLASQGLDPVLKLFKHLQKLVSERDSGPASALAKNAAAIAARSGQAAELAGYLPSPAGQQDHGRPVMLIRLERYGPSPKTKFLLTTWRYTSAGTVARQVECARGPHSERGAKKAISEVLEREIPDLPPGRLMIEFALPDHLLDRAVEAWELNGWRLGVDYAVVVRFAERPRPEERFWKERGRMLEAGQFPAPDSAEWSRRWVNCDDQRTPAQLNGAFQQHSVVPLVALASWRRDSTIPRAVLAARHAGIPALVWKHNGCPDHGTAGQDPASAACEGRRFQQKVIAALAGTEVHEVPEVIRQMRAKAAASPDSGDQPGDQVALLWDDPSRCPWDQAPASSAPER